MKQVILDVLEDVSHGQVNLESKAAREMIVNLIMANIKQLVKDYPNNMELGSKVRELFWEREVQDLDTAGHPVKKINKWLTQDIDEAVMIDDCKDCGDAIAKALGHMDKDGKFITKMNATADEYKDIVDDLDESDIEKKMIWEDSIKEEQEAIDSWVCEICNKSTYDVEYDYIGSGTNHLECELKETL